MSEQGAASGRSMDLPEIHPSTTTISTVAIQAGRAKIVLAILRVSCVFLDYTFFAVM
jgi:hypothetical protein